MCRLSRLVTVLVSILLVAALGAGGPAPAQASPTTLVVDDDGTATAMDCNAGSQAFSAIQDAINAAQAGDTILVCPGTYAEALSITTNNLTIRGKEKGVIIKPAFNNLIETTSLFSGLPQKAIILVDKASGVTLENLTVDGSAAAAGFSGCSPGFMGMFYRGASGTIKNVTVQGVQLPEDFLGCQIQLGIFVQSGKEGGLAAPGPHLNASVVVTGSTVNEYGKNGITCNEAGTSCRIEGNTVTGIGPTDRIGQNGIQLGFGASGAVLSNTVSKNFYTGTGWVACGILIYRAGGVVSGNTLSENQAGVCNSGSQEVPQHPPAQP